MNNSSFLKTVLVCTVCLFICLAMGASSDSSKVIYRGKGFSLERAKDPYADHVSKPAPEETPAVQQEKHKETTKATADVRKKADPVSQKGSKAKSKKHSKLKSKNKPKISEAQPEPTLDQPEEDSKEGLWTRFKAWFKELEMPWYIKWGIIAIIFFSIIRFLTAIGSACPRCRKWSAMQEVDKEIIDEKASNIKVRSKNRVGDIEGYIDQRVPATIYTYRITHRCRFCGHEEIEYKQEKVEN